jgi:hypothetical protein
MIQEVIVGISVTDHQLTAATAVLTAVTVFFAQRALRWAKDSANSEKTSLKLEEYSRRAASLREISTAIARMTQSMDLPLGADPSAAREKLYNEQQFAITLSLKALPGDQLPLCRELARQPTFDDALPLITDAQEQVETELNRVNGDIDRMIQPN